MPPIAVVFVYFIFADPHTGGWTSKQANVWVRAAHTHTYTAHICKSHSFAVFCDVKHDETGQKYREKTASLVLWSNNYRVFILLMFLFVIKGSTAVCYTYFSNCVYWLLIRLQFLPDISFQFIPFFLFFFLFHWNAWSTINSKTNNIVCVM